MTDDTARVQSMIDQGGNVAIPGGTYMIDASKTLRITKDGTQLRMADDVILRAIPNNLEKYCVLRVAANNVMVIGGLIHGERASHVGKTGEWGFGIRVSDGSTNVLIDSVHAISCWGDGIYIDQAKNVRVVHCYCTNNRRQGMSVIDVQGLDVIESEFSNTHGTRPSDGIDIEPDKGRSVNGVTITRCTFRNNAGAGIEIAGKRGTVKNVKITGCKYSGNQPLKIGGIADASKYQPSVYAQLLGVFGVWTSHPTDLVVA